MSRRRATLHLGWTLTFLAATVTASEAQEEGRGGSDGSFRGPSGWVNPLKNRYITGKPLEVCDQGAFFVGGVPKITNFASSDTAEGPPQQIIYRPVVRVVHDSEGAPQVADRHDSRVHSHGRGARRDAGRTAGVVLLRGEQEPGDVSSWISPAAGARDSTTP